MSGAHIVSIGTAVPRYGLEQGALCTAVCQAVPEDDRKTVTIIRRLYRNSGISHRYTVLPDFPRIHGEVSLVPDTPGENRGPSTRVRNQLYEQYITPLAADAAKKALTKAKQPAVTHLITASCTGFSAPGFDIGLIRALGLKHDTARMHLGFMGCYAALPALRMAASICTADRHATVLVVCAELCSLHYRHEFTNSNLMANSLFADGAAAAVIRSKASPANPSFELSSFSSFLYDKTEDEMGWMIGNHGFEMELSPKVPDLIAKTLSTTCTTTCKNGGVSIDRISHWAIHPGGRAILDAAEKALSLDSAALSSSRSVLRNYGNMSSATILFVLKDLLMQKINGSVFTAAFGPGLVAECALMEAHA